MSDYNRYYLSIRKIDSAEDISMSEIVDVLDKHFNKKGHRIPIPDYIFNIQDIDAMRRECFSHNDIHQEYPMSDEDIVDIGNVEGD